MKFFIYELFFWYFCIDKYCGMSSPNDNYVSQNNYNFALNEDFDYLDGLMDELKQAQLSENATGTNQDAVQTAGTDQPEHK